jgi:hypothetical protein
VAEYFRFFDSTENDVREYTAAEFSEYFSKFLSDGVYTENREMGLRVTTINGFNIRVSPGCAFIRGYMYKNDADIEFTLDPPDVVLDRIDRVALKLDIVNRTMNIQLKKGTLGSQPSPPSLIDDSSVKEFPIAQIRVNHGASSGIIIDERVPVSSLIEIPYEDMAREFNDWFEERRQSVGIEVYSGKNEPTNILPGDIWLRELD